MNTRPLAIAAVLITLIICITVYNTSKPMPTDPLAQQLRECSNISTEEKVMDLYYNNQKKVPENPVAK